MNMRQSIALTPGAIVSSFLFVVQVVARVSDASLVERQSVGWWATKVMTNERSCAE